MEKSPVSNSFPISRWPGLEWSAWSRASAFCMPLYLKGRTGQHSQTRALSSFLCIWSYRVLGLKENLIARPPHGPGLWEHWPLPLATASPWMTRSFPYNDVPICFPSPDLQTPMSICLVDISLDCLISIWNESYLKRKAYFTPKFWLFPSTPVNGSIVHLVFPVSPLLSLCTAPSVSKSCRSCLQHRSKSRLSPSLLPPFWF